jgi:hypothetical protein
VRANRGMKIAFQEESGYEYASYHQGAKPSSEERHIELAILVQPLNSGESGSTERGLSGVPLCKVGSEGPCSKDVKGGPGATCGSNSTRHRKCHQPRPSRRGEGQEVCGAFGGYIGGVIGGALGSAPGAVIGAIAGGKAGEKVCHE